MSGAGLRTERRGDVEVIWIDQPERGVPVMTREFIPEFSALIDRLDADASVAGVVLTGAKPGTFLAGADIAAFLEYETEKEVVATVEEGNAVLARLESWRKPFVVAVDGACMGGGTELALAARYLVASSSPKTRFALPEVQLGLLPGLGGTVRLPERVGLTRALTMMLTGRPLYARQARKAGLVHAVHHPEGLVDAAVRAAVALADGKLVVPKRKADLRTSVMEQTPAKSVIFDRAAKEVLRDTGGNYPAPQAILEVTKTWANRGRAAGFKHSEEKFAELVFTREARALIHLFFAQTAAKKNPWKDVAREVGSVGVLGAGLMGAGIAEVSAAAGLEVHLKDRDLGLALGGKNRIYNSLSSRVGKGRTAFERDQIVERVRAAATYEELRAVDLTVEAVLEEPGLKREMVAEVERVTGDGHVFASNTSAIPISEIAAGAARPEAVVGMHYFSPVPKMPLLEIVRTDESADWALGTAYGLGLKQGKTVIVVRDGPGFYTTRALGVYVNEALLALREGVDPLALERAVVQYGFPLGPLAMMDDVGIDVGAKIQDVLAGFLNERGQEPDPASAKLVAGGYLGRKAGKGFYKYEGGKRKKEIDPGALQVAGLREQRQVRTGVAETSEELGERLGLAIVREAVLCLEEGVLASPRDGDLGAVFGFGFPPFRGGPFLMLDDLGATVAVVKFEALQARHGDRFAPPASLRELAASGGSYYGGGYGDAQAAVTGEGGDRE